MCWAGVKFHPTLLDPSADCGRLFVADLHRFVVERRLAQPLFEYARAMEQMIGKDWAIIDYHAKYEDTMVMNMVRGLLTNMLIVFLLCWILTRGGPLSFGNIFLSTVFFGFMAFMLFPYTNFIWYQTPGVWQDFVDALVPWAITGAWLGWWLNKR